MTNIVISFDFDDTLATGLWIPPNQEVYSPLYHIINSVKEYYALGCTCIILTARRESFHNIRDIEFFLKEHNIYDCIKKIVFSNLNLKGEYTKREGVHLHYDDDPSHLEDLVNFGIKVVDSRLNTDYY